VDEAAHVVQIRIGNKLLVITHEENIFLRTFRSKLKDDIKMGCKEMEWDVDKWRRISRVADGPSGFREG
jgi:hypothetical protein